MLILLLIIIVLVLLFGAETVKSWAALFGVILLALTLLKWIAPNMDIATAVKVGGGVLILIAFAVTPRDQWVSSFVESGNKKNERTKKK